MGIFNLFRKPNVLENPSKPITRDALLALSAGSVTWDSFNQNEALKLPIFIACEKVIAETVASLPLIVYRKNGDSRERASDTLVYKILHDEPNEFQSPQVFWEAVIRRAIRYGNAYIFIESNQAGQPASLVLLDNSKIKVKFESTKYFIYGDYKLNNQDVIDIVGLSVDGITGKPITEIASHAIALALAAEEYGLRFFTQGSAVGGTIEIPGSLTVDQYKQLRESWHSAHTGDVNQHKTAILPYGAKYNRQDVPNENAQWIELRKYQLLEMARIFRIPPHMVGDLDRGTFSNIEHQSMQFMTQTITPWLQKIEQEVNRKLLKDQSLFAEYLLEDILRGDTTTRYQAYATGRNNGWLSVNDIRRLENLPLIPGGDVYLQPLNMAPATAIKTEEPKQ